MSPKTAASPRSRGHKKRERTRSQLIEAGLQILAENGDALTISDVVARAEVSNGTFYNYFLDRDALVDALAERSIILLASEVARQTAEEDPARRFAVATSTILSRAVDDPTWGRVVLRLADHRLAPDHEMSRYIREDLASGFDAGRFTFGPDEITLDAILGLLVMTMRRIVRGEVGRDHVRLVVERALILVGVSSQEAADVSAEACR